MFKVQEINIFTILITIELKLIHRHKNTHYSNNITLKGTNNYWASISVNINGLKFPIKDTGEHIGYINRIFLPAIYKRDKG